MVIILASAVVVEGLTFTVGQWTTRAVGLTTMVLEENQIQPEAAEVEVPTTSTTTTFASTTLSTTPTSRPPLPRYKGKRIDDSDLLEAIDRANHRLSEVSDIVNSISDQITKTAPLDCHDSARPTRATSHERLGTSLAITATSEGRIIRFKATPLDGCLPHGLSNAADQVSCYTRWLFKMIDLSPRQPIRPARRFVNMVYVRTLPENDTASTNSSTGSVPTEVLHLKDESYDLDLPPYPLGFPRFSIFPPRRGDLVLNVSNDKPFLDREADDQRQQREQRNADRAQRRAEEQQRQLVPNNLDDAFDMVGDQLVFKTLSANVAVAMANLDRLPDTPECQGLRTSIRAHLIAAMGQTPDLIRRTQAISYTEVTSDQTHRSRASPRPSAHRRSRSPDDGRGRAARRDDRGRDTGRNRGPRHGHDQEVDQGRNRDLRHNLSHKDAHERINRCINVRATHENVRRIEYDAAHGPLGLKQFSSHLRQVIWPRNFKLEKLKKYDGKENPENWITLYEIAV